MQWGSVVFVDESKNFKTVIHGMVFPNGITTRKTDDDTEQVWVVSTSMRRVHVFEIKDSGRLAQTDVVDVECIADNIAADSTGVYIGGHQNLARWIAFVEDPHTLAPSVAVRISPNTNHDVFFGKKFNVDVVIADDGSLWPGGTILIPHPKTNQMFLSGLFTNGIVVCDFE